MNVIPFILQWKNFLPTCWLLVFNIVRHIIGLSQSSSASFNFFIPSVINLNIIKVCLIGHKQMTLNFVWLTLTLLKPCNSYFKGTTTLMKHYVRHTRKSEGTNNLLYLKILFNSKISMFLVMSYVKLIIDNNYPERH